MQFFVKWQKCDSYQCDCYTFIIECKRENLECDFKLMRRLVSRINKNFVLIPNLQYISKS
jgi:hypothetical protein